MIQLMMEKNDQILDEMGTESIDPPEIDSKYRMIILAAQRSKQLQRGALSRTDMDMRSHKATRIAMKEIDEKKVDFSFTDIAESAVEASAH